jgi:hypothetical protein
VVGYGQTPLSFGIDNVVAIPEPHVYALALLGVALLGLRRNRR